MKDDQKIVVGQYYPALDGLRAIAVFLVLWFHSSMYGYEINPKVTSELIESYFFLSIFGKTGVDLFFVLSGFLITGILMDTSETKNVYRNFYVRRTLRIFPLYYVFLIFSMIVVFLFGQHGQGYGGFMLWHFLYLQNWLSDFSLQAGGFLGHTWTLAIEEQFYLVWPVLFLFFYRRSEKGAVWLCVCLVVMCWFMRAYVMQYSEKLAVSGTIFRMDGLVLGALLSVLCFHFRDCAIKLAGGARYIFASVFIFSMALIYYSESFAEVFLALIRWGVCLLVLLYGMMVLHVVLKHKNYSSFEFLKSKFLIGIGRVSYGIYIFHLPIMVGIAKIIKVYQFHYIVNHLIIFIVGFLLTFVIAVASYKFFEKPIVNMKDKWAPNDIA